MSEPIIPPERIREPAELLATAESLTVGDVEQASMAGMAVLGPGGLAGIMLAFQDAATSDCQCIPCVTLREIGRKLIHGLD
jgi:hypothetical protein